MRRRLTFIHNPSHNVDDSELRLEGSELRIDGLEAAREERLTFSFKELPKEVQTIPFVSEADCRSDSLFSSF